jgi:hypothetical protein
MHSANRLPVGYFDIESADWDTFVVGALLPPGQSRPNFVWHSSAEFLDAMLEYGRVEWRAHNGGRYDVLLLLSHVQKRGWKIRATMRGAAVLRAECFAPGAGKPNIVFTDTFALAPVSLDSLAKSAGLTQKRKFDYSSITKHLDKNSKLGRELASYLEADVLALRDGDMAWRNVLRDVARVEPALTIGATAWRSASKEIAKLCDELGEPLDHPLSNTQYEISREGYYGGRVEVFRTRASSGQRYDRNSSYPAALTRARLPVGARVMSRAWESAEGTVWARVRVRECVAPPLPVRLPGHVVFPSGVFDGVWTCRELRSAIATGDARIIRVHGARVARHSEPLLRDWCLRVWKERVNRPSWSTLLKLLANSLTGKLAQRPEREELVFCKEGEEPEGASPIGPARDGGRWYAVSRVAVPDCARPEWAATLTAEARESLLAQLVSVGDDAVYCDTDSVYALDGAHVRDVGAELGQWKHEGPMRDWRAEAPKVYAYKNENGSTKVRAKGMPGLDAGGYEALARGTPWEVRRGVETLRATIRRDGYVDFRARVLERALRPVSGWVGARVRDGDYSTRAPTYAEAMKRFG